MVVAENEQLDATHSRKWLPVARAIAGGASSRGVADQIEKTFCQRLRRLQADGLLPSMIEALWLTFERLALSERTVMRESTLIFIDATQRSGTSLSV